MQHWLFVAWSLIGLVSWAGAGRAQAVTFADLEGSVIEASTTEMRTARAEGRTGQQRAQMHSRIAIGADESIQYNLTLTIHRIQKGDTDTRSWSAKSKLGAPHSFRDGQAVWVFEDGTLTHLRTQDQGGRLVKVTFARGERGLSCTVTRAFAREDGVGALQTKSNTHGVAKVEFLSVKEVATSCRVTKR